MKSRREVRPNRKSSAEKARERALRDRLQREKPSLDDLVRAGDVDPAAVMTMGTYFDVQSALQGLKQDRERLGLSIGDVAKSSGLDRAVISRLENGKQDNPTVATLTRYAAAMGKRFLWTYEDERKASRRSKRSA
jgi:DNA-binding XRE family transcriptional regulator